jgi:hypothetical protein
MSESARQHNRYFCGRAGPGPRVQAQVIVLGAYYKHRCVLVKSKERYVVSVKSVHLSVTADVVSI